MISLVTGNIYKGFLKGGASVAIATAGTGTIKTISNSGEQTVVSFTTVGASRVFGPYHQDVDFEIYVENGSCQFDSPYMFTESFRKVDATSKSADIFEMDENGDVVGLLHPKTGQTVSLGGGGMPVTATQVDTLESSVTGLRTGNSNQPNYNAEYKLRAYNQYSRNMASEELRARGESLYFAANTIEEVGVGETSGYAYVSEWGTTQSGSNCVVDFNYRNSADNANDRSNFDRRIVAYSTNEYRAVIESFDTNAGFLYVGEYESWLYGTRGNSMLKVDNTGASMSHEYRDRVGSTVGGKRISKSTTNSVIETFEATNIVFDIIGALAVNATAQTGANSAAFNPTNAPVAGLTVTNWLKVKLNGVEGYIPFFSA